MCGAPPRVSVSSVSSPCRSFSLSRPPLSRVCAAPGRALVFVAACCCSRPRPPHPIPTLRLLPSTPPVCFWVSRARLRLCPPPPSGGLRFAAGGVLLRVYPCCLRALSRCSVCRRLLLSHPPPGFCVSRVSLPCCSSSSVLPLPSTGSAMLGRWFPPPSPRFVSPGCRRPAAHFSCVLLLLPCFFPCLWPWHLFGWGSISPLGSRPFVALCIVCWYRAPPPPPVVALGGVRCPASCCAVPQLGVGRFVRCPVFCCAVLSCCAGALLCGVLFCCGVCFVVGCLPLALAAPFLLVPLRPAVLCGVSTCVVPPSVVVCCGIFCVALWCPCCGHVLSLTSRFCAPAGLRCLVLPPPPLVCVSCLLPICVAVLCWLVLCFVVLCCCLLCCVVRGAACRVVVCGVLLCFASGVVLRWV